MKILPFCVLLEIFGGSSQSSNREAITKEINRLRADFATGQIGEEHFLQRLKELQNMLDSNQLGHRLGLQFKRKR